MAEWARRAGSSIPRIREIPHSFGGWAGWVGCRRGSRIRQGRQGAVAYRRYHTAERPLSYRDATQGDPEEAETASGGVRAGADCRAFGRQPGAAHGSPRTLNRGFTDLTPHDWTARDSFSRDAVAYAPQAGSTVVVRSCAEPTPGFYEQSPGVRVDGISAASVGEPIPLLRRFAGLPGGVCRAADRKAAQPRTPDQANED